MRGGGGRILNHFFHGGGNAVALEKFWRGEIMMDGGNYANIIDLGQLRVFSPTHKITERDTNFFIVLDFYK